MKKLFFLMLLFSVIPLFSQSARGSKAVETKSSKSGIKRALIIGISDYSSSDLTLKYADDDAILFKNYLTKIEKVKEENIALLINEKATSFNILNELQNLISSTEENDIVYLFFAGHGDVVDKDNVKEQLGFLLAYDVNQNREFYGTQGVIPFKDISLTVNTIASKDAKITLVLDACRSGYLSADGAQNNLKTFNQYLQNSTKLLSCNPNELSYEGDNLKLSEENTGHGYFTYYLVLGLMGAADNLVQDNKLQYFELQGFLDTNVNLATNNKQTPVVKSKTSTGIFKEVFSLDKKEALEQIQNPTGIQNILASRSNSDTNEKGLELNSDLIKKFNEALEKKNYYGTSLSAFELIKQAIKEEKTDLNIIRLMKNKLVVALSTKAQLLINDYIGNVENLPNGNVFQQNAKHLEICLELIEKENFSYNRILTSKLFLEAYAIIRAKHYSKYPEAKQKLKEALKIEDRAAYIHNALGVILNNENNFKDSEYHYKQANMLIPTWMFPVNNIGTNFYDQYRYSEAEIYFQDALKLKSSYGSALNNLGAIRESQGKYTEAEAYFHLANQSNKGYTSTTLRNLGALYEKKGNIKKALEYYERALLKNPNNVDTYYSFSELLLEEYIDVKRAEALLKKAIKIEPFFSKGHTAYAEFLRYYVKTADSDKEALERYDFAISNDPYYTESYAGKGWLLHKQDLKEEALASFNKSIEVNPFKPKPYYFLAEYYEKGLEDQLKAEEFYFKAIEKDSFYLATYKGLVDLYNKNNQENKSLAVLNKLATWNTEAPDVWNLLGNTYFAIGDYNNAISKYKKAIQVDSTYAKGFTNLAYSFMKTGRYNEAAEKYKKAVLYNPFKNKLESFATLLLTEARKEKKNKVAAKEILTEAYTLIQNFETTFALATFNYLNNNPKEASKISNSLKLEELSKTRKIKYSELLCKIALDLNLKKESQDYFNQLKGINPRPNNVLNALVKLINNDKKGAKETLSKTNTLMLRDAFLEKKYSQNSINKIKQLQNE